MQIPQSDILTTQRLARVFDEKSATYKFFWFLSILQHRQYMDSLRMNVRDLVCRMVANAWHPILCFNLSFGKVDSLNRIVRELKILTGLSVDAEVETVYHELHHRKNETAFLRCMDILTRNVPYRFLKPWIDTQNDEELMYRSQTLENHCLYSIHKEPLTFYIKLNPIWDNYLHTHSNILKDFSYWNLMKFLQQRNPNTPICLNKLVRPDMKSLLAKQYAYWNTAMSFGAPYHCIYTDRKIDPSEYTLDHFLPWSFLSHHQLWNLVPTTHLISSAKNNKLPELTHYLSKMAATQQRALQTFVRSGKTSEVLNDYKSLGYAPQELAALSSYDFLQVYEQTLLPMNRVAQNMGFETWKYQ